MASVHNRVGFRFFPGILQLLRSLGVEIVESEIQSIDMHQQAGLNGERRSSRAKASPNLDVSIFDPLPDDPFEAFKLENDKVPDWAPVWSSPGIDWTIIPMEEWRAQRMIHNLIRSEKHYLHKLLVLRFLYKHRYIQNTTATGKSFRPDDIPGYEDIYLANKTLLHDPLVSFQVLQQPRIFTMVNIMKEWWDKSRNLYVTYIPRYSRCFNETRVNKQFRSYIKAIQRDHQSRGFSLAECLVAPLEELDNIMDVLQSTSGVFLNQPELAGSIGDLYQSVKLTRGTAMNTVSKVLHSNLSTYSFFDTR